jgi:hypothetical protein
MFIYIGWGFHASRYSMDMLENTTHNHELKADDKVHVHIDSRSMGLGGMYANSFICFYAYLHVCIYIHICIYEYTCIYIYIYIYIYMCISIAVVWAWEVCMRIHLYVFIHIHMYVYIYVCIFKYIYTFIYIYIYTYLHILIYIDSRSDVCKRI